MRINTLLNDDAPSSTPAPKGPGRGNWRRNPTSAISGARGFKAKLDASNSQEGLSPSAGAGVPPVSSYNGPHGFYLPLNGTDPIHKRTRPLTQHQLAVEQYRRRRVEVILDRSLRIEYQHAKKRRKRDGSFMRSWVRCKGMMDGYDTDEESAIQEQRQTDVDAGGKTPPPMFAGLVPLDYGGEVNDHGEEAYYRSKMLTRALRRFERWEGGRQGVRSKGKARADAERSFDGDQADALERGEEDFADEDEEMQDGDGDEGERRDDDESSEEEDEDEGYEGLALPHLSTLVH
jgi:Ino eighty subunit 1